MIVPVIARVPTDKQRRTDLRYGGTYARARVPGLWRPMLSPDEAIAERRLAEIAANPESLVKGEDLTERLAAVAIDLAKQQQSLGEEYSEVLHANLWDLYARA